jgi:hypothetical protein
MRLVRSRAGGARRKNPEIKAKKNLGNPSGDHRRGFRTFAAASATVAIAAAPRRQAQTLESLT